MARYFTLKQAQDLVSQLEGAVRQAVRLNVDLAGAAAELNAYSQHVAMAGGAIVDQRKFLGLQSRRDALERRLKEIVASIHEHGCQIKDLSMGLLDFPTRYRGSEACLCWKLGEREIAYWHGVEEGFRGRKEIDDDFRKNHRGDDPPR